MLDFSKMLLRGKIWAEWKHSACVILKLYLGEISMINIFYDITMNCNLRCKHCYNAKHLKKGIPETIDIEKTFSNLLKLNPDIIIWIDNFCMIFSLLSIM